jgi:hypothetical protein
MLANQSRLVDVQPVQPVQPVQTVVDVDTFDMPSRLIGLYPQLNNNNNNNNNNKNICAIKSYSLSLGGRLLDTRVYDAELGMFVHAPDDIYGRDNTNKFAAYTNDLLFGTKTFGEHCQECWTMPGARLDSNQFSFLCGDMIYSPPVSSMGRAVYNMYQAAKKCRTGRLCDEVLYRLWQVAWLTFRCNLASSSHQYKHKLMMQCIKKYQKSDQHTDYTDQCGDQYGLVSQCVDQALDVFYSAHD